MAIFDAEIQDKGQIFDLVISLVLSELVEIGVHQILYWIYA
jgi:hypothetical protein